jgi:hypothetical protein
VVGVPNVSVKENTRASFRFLFHPLVYQIWRNPKLDISQFAAMLRRPFLCSLSESLRRWCYILLSPFNAMLFGRLGESIAI